jgi:hypothetical protein
MILRVYSTRKYNRSRPTTMGKGRFQLHHVRPATRSDRSTSEMLDERERLLLRVLLPPRQSLDSRAERGCDSF